MKICLRRGVSHAVSSGRRTYYAYSHPQITVHIIRIHSYARCLRRAHRRGPQDDH